MSNRLNKPAVRRIPIWREDDSGGWTTLDYMLAAGFAWSIAGGSPVLMAPPFWVCGLMAPPD